jgi:hypothetical protein
MVYDRRLYPGERKLDGELKVTDRLKSLEFMTSFQTAPHPDFEFYNSILRIDDTLQKIKCLKQLNSAARAIHPVLGPIGGLCSPPVCPSKAGGIGITSLF